MHRTAIAARLGVPLTVCALAASAVPAPAAFLLTTSPGAAGQVAEIRRAGNPFGGITTAVRVGSTDVTIGGFGTYGRLAANGGLRFVIFEAGTRGRPVYDSGQVPTTGSAAAGWYYSPMLTYTLRAGTEYRIGVIADRDFTYYWSVGGADVTAGGLTAVGGVSGNTGRSFTAPVDFGDGAVSNPIRILPRDPTTVTPAPPGIVLALTGLPAIALVWILRLVRGRARAS